MEDIWAVARFDLGLSTTEFGELSPALFESLVERKRQADREEYLRAGIIASSIINSSMGAPEKAISPWDFVPGEKEQKETMDLTQMTPEDQASYVLKMFNKIKRTRKKR